ncbi:hypothetical protein MY978_06935 [Haemophilus influenzae]|uniref:hypothetical protein n=1 Tax=Haemophilus influenzae TaxID=727 RepID=UPI00059B2BD6|nr:hypothetical protein [Haemophilus influenzae]TWV01208.1 hypothetical protein FRC22_07385 [Haemophilus influenzae]
MYNKKHYCTGLKNAPENINSCCHQHDRDYGVNSKITRQEADRRLRECLISQDRPIFAWFVWIVVRLFGWYFFKHKKYS